MDVRTVNGYEHIEEPADDEEVVTRQKPVMSAEEIHLEDIRRMAMKQAKRVKNPETDKKYHLDRRTAHQTYGHLMAAIDRMFDFKMEAKSKKKLDDVQFAGDAIFNMKQAVAYLNMICRHEFGCDAEDLSAYK